MQNTDFFSFQHIWSIIASGIAVSSLLSTGVLWFVTHQWNKKRARISDFNYHIIDQIIPLLNEIQSIELRWNKNSLMNAEMSFSEMNAEFERFKYRFNIAIQNASDALKCGDLFEYFKFNEMDKISEILIINAENYKPNLFRRSTHGSVKSIYTSVMNGISEMRDVYVISGVDACKKHLNVKSNRSSV